MGLPWTASTVPTNSGARRPSAADGAALSRTCQTRVLPCESTASTSRDQAGSSPVSEAGGSCAAWRVNEVFRPDPMPMHSTRSPATSEPACRASVMGTEAGPTLPRIGNVSGTRSGSMPSRAHSELVCTEDTWWIT